MPTAKLTQSLAASAGPGAYWDTDMKGLGLIVRPTGTKSWVVQKSGRKRWTLGRWPAMTCAAARRRYPDVVYAPDTSPATITLADALEVHLGRMKKRGNTSWDLVEYEVKRHLSDWMERPLTAITKQACHDRHVRITGRVGDATGDRVMRHLRAVWNSAEKRVDLPRNPTIGVEWHGVRRRDYPRLDLNEWWSQVLGIENDARRDWQIVALSTGLRAHDCSTIRWEHVDLPGLTLHRPEPKGGKARAFTLPLSPQTAGIIAARPRTGPFVFPGRSGGALATPRVRGLPNPHHLRSEYLQIATDLEVPAYHKKLLVNHAVPRADVTDGYVAAPDIEICRPYQDRISNHIFGVVEST
ncbi:MAG: integrase family protein [Pseudomonadota bacterium]